MSATDTTLGQIAPTIESTLNGSMIGGYASRRLPISSGRLATTRAISRTSTGPERRHVCLPTAEQEHVDPPPRKQKAPRFAGLSLEADEGIRTLDLRHGKATL
jgi:hypothetical protein